MSNTIEFLRAGIFSSVQDMKRVGFKKYGIPKSGPMDDYSHILSNWLVDNDIYSETIEFTHLGPKIRFNFDSQIGVFGCVCDISINNIKISVGKSYPVKDGDILDIGQCFDGNRGYLSISGSMDIKKDYNSFSTYDKINIGGLNGRKLKNNDIIPFKTYSSKNQSVKKIPESFHRRYKHSNTIRVVKGIHFDFFDKESLSNDFSILPESDRMGIRLRGNLKMSKDQEITSTVVSKGTIQVPRDGNPIILMSDAQSTGGYPIIGSISAVDIPKLAQIRPNSNIVFKYISLEESEKLIEFEKRKFLSQLKIKL